MPRKMDNDTRLNFRIFEDGEHAQKRAFCLHCNKDACADNIQRMKNHLLKCEPYLNSRAPEAVFQLDVEGPIAPDTPMHGLAPGSGPEAAPGPSRDPNGRTQQRIAPAPANTSIIMGTPTEPGNPTSTNIKATQESLTKVRTAMARSTKRLENLEAVLKTQVQDGMHNAATHVRAAMRDERDRLFKLSQTLVKQETKVREAQTALGSY